MSETVWQCDQLRAGHVYTRTVFNTKAEAESYVAQMRRVDPDLTWRVEPIPASAVWN